MSTLAFLTRGADRSRAGEAILENAVPSTAVAPNAQHAPDADNGDRRFRKLLDSGIGALDDRGLARARWHAAIRTAEVALGGKIWRARELIDFLDKRFDANAAKSAGPVFVPRAVVDGEARMGLTPIGVQLLRALGVENPIYVESEAGINRYTGAVYYSDDDYRAAGAIVLDKDALTKQARQENRKLVVSIKEPQPSEFALIEGADLYTYLHLADLPDLTRTLTHLVRSATAYETIAHKDPASGLVKTPVLAPASHGAGWLSALRYAVFSRYGDSDRSDAALEKRFRELSASYPKVPTRLRDALRGKTVTILGGGVSGESAAIALAKMGAKVTITEAQEARIAELKRHFAKERVAIEVLERKDFRTPLAESKDTAIIEALEKSNAVIGAILIPGAPAPKEVSRATYERLVKGGKLEFIADIAIDQGGNFEIPKPDARHYKYSDGWPRRNGVEEFIVTNMPSAIPKQISHGLERAKIAYLLAMLSGFPAAVDAFPELSGGLNIHRGRVTNAQVAKKHDLECVPPEEAIRA
jgi:alanine dehydrogenase